MINGLITSPHSVSCSECLECIPANTRYRWIVGSLRHVDGSLSVAICNQCWHNWQAILKAEQANGIYDSSIEFGELCKRILDAYTKGLKSLQYRIVSRWLRLKPTIDDAAWKHRPATQPQTRQISASSEHELRNRFGLRRNQAILYGDKPNPPAPTVDWTGFSAEELIARFERDMKSDRYDRHAFGQSLARRELCRRWEASLPVICRYLAEHQSRMPTVLRMAWGNLFMKIQMALDPLNETAPENYDDVSGWLTWAKSFIVAKKLSATV